MIPKPLINLHHELGEGPLWDAQRGCLWWVNIMAGEVHQYRLASSTHRMIQLDRPVGTLGLTKTERLIIAWESGFAWLDPQTGNVNPIKNEETAQSGIRFNEGKPGPDGGFWAGTMAYDQQPGAAALFHLKPDLTIAKVVDGLTISNGLAWTADNQTMYFIDTPTHEVAAFDFDAAAGRLTNRRVAFAIDPDLGYPDGMAIDVEGMLWIAMYGGHAVHRWHPKTGEKLETIAVPTANVTSCVFGGPELKTLFITTAGGGSQAEDDLAGAVYAVDLPIQGTAPFRFHLSKANI
ncbi:MAG: SMP-30/gluconolactonase/LRE family protein [Ardenticatenaceae bacterium]|nr:SMP-30/gluconolactonase/LRE family protein [Ardenticatenaceae bacterium]